jgi:17beta-estradiol 17-dehydrogenase / very-long-chain 3-oxoacyl-CoA reductase
MSEALYRPLAVVGAATVAYFGYQTLSALSFQLHRSKLQRYHHGAEPWALVTGASDGIGFAFSNELAKRNFNVVVHGRSVDKLKRVVADLQSKHPQRKFKTLVLEATKPADATFDKTVLDAVQGLNLTVVIHNIAGSGGAAPAMPMFQDYTAKEVDGWVTGKSKS